jgi:hypothetical protein
VRVVPKRPESGHPSSIRSARSLCAARRRQRSRRTSVVTSAALRARCDRGGQFGVRSAGQPAGVRGSWRKRGQSTGAEKHAPKKPHPAKNLPGATCCWFCHAGDQIACATNWLLTDNRQSRKLHTLQRAAEAFKLLGPPKREAEIQGPTLTRPTSSILGLSNESKVASAEARAAFFAFLASALQTEWSRVWISGY